MYSFIALKSVRPSTSEEPRLPSYCRDSCTFLEGIENVSQTGEISYTYRCWAHNKSEISDIDDLTAEGIRPEWCPLYKVSIDITGYTMEDTNETESTEG